jgi:hypothetical protein
MKRAILVAIGAAVGPFIGGLSFRFLVMEDESSRGLPPMLYVAVLVGAAVFTLVGFLLGSLGAQSAQESAATRTKKALLCTLGGAVGPFIGFFAIQQIYTCIEHVTGHANEWSGLEATFAGAAAGLPIGGIIFSLIGLAIGSMLTRSSTAPEPKKE